MTDMRTIWNGAAADICLEHPNIEEVDMTTRMQRSGAEDVKSEREMEIVPGIHIRLHAARKMRKGTITRANRLVLV